MAKTLIAAFYKFTDLPQFRDLKPELEAFCAERGLKGSILLAPEGINSTLSGSENAVMDLLAHLSAMPEFHNLGYKLSWASEQPFGRMKVRLKKEIVGLGDPSFELDLRPHDRMGIEVPPEDWNALISDPEVVLIDTRNDYEIGIGTFQGAIDPKTKGFKDFPDYVKQNYDPKKHKKVAMFCTGGIRCEKASAYMMAEGFEAVYQLKGGILQYLEDIPAENSMWEGECFVFDERVAVGHGLEISDHEMCLSCGFPVSAEDRQSEKFEAGITCPHCYDTITPERIARSRERMKQLKLAEERGEAC